MYASSSGSAEIFHVDTFTDFDREVFFAILTSDGSNEAQLSNIVSVFINAITTTTGKDCLQIWLDFRHIRPRVLSNFQVIELLP